jgi:cysteine synthase A
MKGAIEKADKIAAAIPNSYTSRQFDNPANPEAHRRTTAEEIWSDTDGRVDILVVGVGTGGTLTGVGEVLKSRKNELQVVAVEPSSSAVLSGGLPGRHRIYGLGAGFVPQVLNMAIIDEIFRVEDEQARGAVRSLARRNGLLVGPAAGAVAFAASQIAARPSNQGKLIVAVFPDAGEPYFSTEFH